ncbi:hypothetical protein UA16_01872 [Burkholderia multivorans]|nr:hypothetical protein UA16_01872 [Burkholderia multivorans]
MIRRRVDFGWNAGGYDFSQIFGSSQETVEAFESDCVT